MWNHHILEVKLRGLSMSKCPVKDPAKNRGEKEMLNRM